MELNNFRQKLIELHKKSRMDEFINWPFVYDKDEEGEIFISDGGTFYLRDVCHRWNPTLLNVGDVYDMKYSIAFDEPTIDPSETEEDPSESTIFLRFSDGSKVYLTNYHDTYDVLVRFCLNHTPEGRDYEAFRDYDLIRKGARVDIYNKGPLCPRNEEPWSTFAGNLDVAENRRLLQDYSADSASDESGRYTDAVDEYCTLRKKDSLTQVFLKLVADIFVLDDLVLRHENEGQEYEDGAFMGAAGQIAERAKECAQVSHYNVAEAIFEAWQFYESFTDDTNRDRSDFTEMAVARLAESWLEKNGMLEEYVSASEDGAKEE
ncbi:MAG: hypothetical protein IJ113_01645 [Eggerthellaceae bacterium]|nr:hypothetical protein [Eggerthellaceae bacterium]